MYNVPIVGMPDDGTMLQNCLLLEALPVTFASKHLQYGIDSIKKACKGMLQKEQSKLGICDMQT